MSCYCGKEDGEGGGEEGGEGGGEGGRHTNIAPDNTAARPEAKAEAEAATHHER